MEQRTLLTTFTVINTLDSGDGSLRQALLNANAQSGPDRIEFSIGSGEQVIQPLTALPEITDSVTIDGSTQPGFVDGFPLIVLNGDLLANDTFIDGLTISTSDSLIKGLVINGFDEGSGIVIGGFGSSGVTGNRVEGNIIGLNSLGTTAVPNSDGIQIGNGASGNVIGGLGIAGNVISGNGFGIAIGGTGTSNNRVIGNVIGTSRDRTVAVGNGYGVGIGNGGTENEIGGSGQGEGNLISGNVNHGIFIDGVNTSDNVIRGNRIGTDLEGTVSLGQFTSSAGIGLSGGTHGNVIGGSGAGDRNLIAGVTGDGITISDASTHGNIIQGNYIGVSLDGLTAIGNRDDGIDIINSPNNLIGGDVAGAGNVISGSGRHGITIFGETADGNLVRGNFIGTNAAGTAALSNASDGIRIDGGSANGVGGPLPGESNLISGNLGNGITLTGGGTSWNTVGGNLIGVASDGTTPLPNGINGIQADAGASFNVIGGDTEAYWNLVAFNGFNGIEISGSNTVSIAIGGNRIFSNAGLQIDLGGDGVTANDVSDSDNGPNGFQNTPVLGSANASTLQLSVTGQLDSKPSATYTINFYSNTTNDANANGQAQTAIGTLAVTTDSNGFASFNALLPFVEPGRLITATARDSAGNTSEISASRVVVGGTTANPILVMPGTEPNYTLKQTAIVVDGSATVTDSDSTTFNTGNLTVSFNSKGESGEKLKVRNQGTGANQINVKGSKISYGNVLIGKAKGGSGKKPLVVTFVEGATPAAVTALLQNITYVHTGRKTQLSERTLQFRVTDEAEHVSNAVNKKINIL